MTMQSLDREQLEALECAIHHDALVLQAEDITRRAAKDSPSLHANCEATLKRTLLEQLLQDAAVYGYSAQELPQLYNCALWVQKSFYREAPYAALFGEVLLDGAARVMRLYTLLRLAKHKILSERPWYASLADDPLAGRLARIHDEQQRAKEYHNSADELVQLKGRQLTLEYQGLLLALLRHVVGAHATDWRPLACTVDDMVHLQHTAAKRYLTLRMVCDERLILLSEEFEGTQQLVLALPEALSEKSIAAFEHWLGAYTLDLEPAARLTKEFEAQVKQDTANTTTTQTKEKAHAKSST